ncbi:transporter substrate-binding domain-containing protein [Shewanella electrodiphila]|uniref:Transporter substrate-binding domain-containing protein n=1 Tax=Shewanella electrodiphila TaxID=934143 RepID=A0ABT0KSV6_9GAMM|nr:transporter substrate-binding domain-containing protein [Shewanella electrodiphila]MCL1046415.1 transporter substrate-binding domain-containing protein [Shewanella electrodiphila]
MTLKTDLAKILKYCIGLMLFASCSFSTSLSAKPLLIASDIWCPYVCEARTGYVTELTQRAFAEMDQPVHFIAVPFNRALKEVQQANVDAILAVTPDHVAQYDLLTDDLIIGYASKDFYTTNSFAWQFNQIEDLDTVQVGIIRGYDYGERLNAKIANSNRFYIASGNQPLTMNLKRLIKGRFHVMIGNKIVIEQTAKKINLDDQIRYAGSFGEPIPLYVGFNQGNTKAAKMFADGLKKLKQTGEFQQILDKYNIEMSDDSTF